MKRGWAVGGGFYVGLVCQNNQVDEEDHPNCNEQADAGSCGPHSPTVGGASDLIHRNKPSAARKPAKRTLGNMLTMKSHTEYLTFNISTRVGFINMTSQVEEAVAKSGIMEGLVLCNAMHITASVFINDNERGLLEDYRKWLEQLAPFDASPQRYAHNRTGEDNADAHMKRQIMGREVVVAITAGKLDFGPWEQIFYGEFDGRRSKRVLIKVIGE